MADLELVMHFFQAGLKLTEIIPPLLLPLPLQCWNLRHITIGLPHLCLSCSMNDHFNVFSNEFCKVLTFKNNVKLMISELTKVPYVEGKLGTYLPHLTVTSKIFHNSAWQEKVTSKLTKIFLWNKDTEEE